MLDKTQLTKVAVAGFGAAMASVYAIPEAHATIIPISFSPGSVAYTATVAGSNKYKAVTGGSSFFPILSLGVANNSYVKNMTMGTASSLAPMLPGEVASALQFSGTHFLGNGVAASETEYVGFRNHDGSAGWFAVNLGGQGGSITFLKGAYNTEEGGSIVVGQMAASVPEPSEIGLLALGLLALGAAGVRQRREARKLAEPN